MVILHTIYGGLYGEAPMRGLVRVSLISLFVVPSAAAQTGESAFVRPSSDRPENVLMVRRQTTLYAASTAGILPIGMLPPNTLLTQTSAPASFPQVYCSPPLIPVALSPSAGLTVYGWVDPRDTMRLAPSHADEIAGASTQERRTGNAMADHGSEPIPALIRLKKAEQQWREVQSLVYEAEKRGKQIPEVYRARAMMWSSLQNYEKALVDYLRAAEIAINSGPEHDLVTAGTYFYVLLHALQNFRELPRPPAVGDAREYYGAGVHALRDNRLREAVRYFSDAIDLNVYEPVYYYYRSVAYRRLGDLSSAIRDARVGSYYEEKLFDLERRRIDVALEYIQGNDRTWLENIRRGEPHYDPYRDPSLPPELRPPSGN